VQTPTHEGLRICEVDALPEDDEPGHAVFLVGYSDIYVCTEGSGQARFGSCGFKAVAVLPQNNIGVVLLGDKHPYAQIGEIGGFVFLLGDKHVYVAV
jgi:hypothetical protein